MIGLVLGIALVSPATETVVAVLLTYSVIRAQVNREEQHLTALHSDLYLEWASRTGRFVPGIGLLNPPKNSERS